MDQNAISARYQTRIDRCIGALQAVAIVMGALSLTSGPWEQHPFRSALDYGVTELLSPTDGRLGPFIVVITLLISAVLLVSAHFAGQGKARAMLFALGILVLDGIVLVFIGHWWAVVYHAYVIVWLVRGFLAMRQMRLIQQSTM